MLAFPFTSGSDDIFFAAVVVLLCQSQTQDNTATTPRPIRDLVKEKSVTMEYFLEVSHLDSATAALLQKFDRDGNGSFSKDEVVAIILDLSRDAMQSNEMLGASNKMFKKRMLVIAILFCILLLTSMFGLSYAVAALPAKIHVNSEGVRDDHCGAGWQ